LESRVPVLNEVKDAALAVGAEHGNLWPSLLTQVLRIDTDYVPSLVVADFVHEVAASDTRFCNCLVTVSKGRNIEFLELEDLHKIYMSVGDQNGSYNIRSQAFCRRNDESCWEQSYREIRIQVGTPSHFLKNDDWDTEERRFAATSRNAAENITAVKDTSNELQLPRM
jgi:hypothetical protein